MKNTNGDLPALPVDMTNDKLLQMMALGLNDALAKSAARAMMGLTKREMFAMAAMQGLIGVAWKDIDTYNSADELLKNIAESSVEHADALLKALEVHDGL